MSKQFLMQKYEEAKRLCESKCGGDRECFRCCVLRFFFPNAICRPRQNSV